ncbi:uncharacterized protein [Physcomitrium patens]|uniref:uncharacterized protein isoform X2 n=1 Tax=Physcomitrium patens TaxID=3218 RepID=UPI000D16B610|nr:geranylgeranyl transferase type-1 subunit beta-like isoform X2 [Physcomitrium patens]|eukprot:XP_024398964.1 geranylgeranyl transferase type-1 subunit beta-like isoform X2 [Physcomitrella patens]
MGVQVIFTSTCRFMFSWKPRLLKCGKIPAVNIIEWICSLQVLPLAADHPSSSVNKIPSNFYDEGHSASTYLAQCILRILGDNLSCVEAEAILSTVHDPQQPDGSPTRMLLAYIQILRLMVRLSTSFL